MNVRQGKRLWTLHETPMEGEQVDGHTFAAQVGLKFKGVTFKPEGETLIDSKTNEKLILPHRSVPPGEGMYSPLFRCKGAMSLGKTMLWLWAWDNIDALAEPSFVVFAYEIAYEGGHLKLLHQAEVPAATGYLPDLGPRYGDCVLLGGGEKKAIFDLKAWRQIGEAPGACFTALSGVTYRQDGQTLWQRRPKDHDWVPLPKTRLGELKGTFTLSNGDILLFTEGLMAVKTGKTYALPENIFLRSYFFNPKLGLAVVWTYAPQKQPVGVVLNSNLVPICPVHALEPQAVPE